MKNKWRTLFFILFGANALIIILLSIFIFVLPGEEPPSRPDREVRRHQAAGHAHVAVLDVRGQARIAEERQHECDDGDKSETGDKEDGAGVGKRALAARDAVGRHPLIVVNAPRA